MINNKIIRRLERFIENGGTIKDLKRILSICANDEDFAIELLKTY